MTKGEVYWTSLYKDFGTSIQGGYRPVVVISSPVGCLSSDVVMVVPLSTKIKLHNCNAQLNFKLRDDVPQMAICNQIRTVAKERLENFSGVLDIEDLEKIETAILVSLGIAKPVADSIKLSQERLAQQKADRDALENLIPQAKSIITNLTEILNRQEIKRTRSAKHDYTRKYNRVKRSDQDIEDFMKEFSDPHNNRNEVAEAFGFSNYSSAYNFYWNRKKKEKKNDGSSES